MPLHETLYIPLSARGERGVHKDSKSNANSPAPLPRGEGRMKRPSFALNPPG